MKTVKVLWMLPLALSSLMQSQAGVVAPLETSYIKVRPALKEGATKKTIANLTGKQPAAFFLGADAPAGLAAGSVDDGVLAAYRAIAAAKTRIRENGGCRKFFHGEGEQSLDRMRFTMQYLKVPAIAAQVDGSVVLLNRSPDSLFIKPPQEFMGLSDPGEIRAFYILHELAHALSRYTRYVNDHTASAKNSELRTGLNNQLLLENCYKASHTMVATR